MKIYVLTSDFETVAVMDNTLDSALHYFDDEFHRYLENGASTFDLSVVKPFKRYGNATDGTEDDYQYLVENNYLVFTYQDKDYMFNIRRVEETETSMRVYCQNLSLDLLNEYRAPFTADKAYSLKKYVDDCLTDSGYTIGINEFSSNTRTLKWEGDQTVLARILSIANSFGAEVEFETVLNADRTIEKNLVHFRKRVGVNRPDIELKYGKNVSSIRRTVDIDDLVTGLKVRGHEEDGKVTTIKNVVKSEKNANGIEEFYTRKGSEYILAPLATQQYGRKNASGGGHIIGQYEYDTKSDTELYNRALTELKKRCVPSYEYEIEGYYDVNIGDTIRAIDEAYNPILILEARVSEQIISFSDPSKNQTKYSNYKVLENKVSQSLLDRVNELAQMAKILQYGIDFEGSPVFKNGEGTLKMYAHVDRNNVEVTDEFTEYNWTKRNSDGTIDEAWTNAHQDFGQVVTVTSDDIDGTAVFSFTVEINGEQVGNATITVSEVYDGDPGSQGIPGTPGADGRTPYLHTAYAWSADGTDRFTTVYPGENAFLDSEREITNGDIPNPEFLSPTWLDITSLIDKHGIDQWYTISFDLASKDITNSNQVRFYPYPGSPPPGKYLFPIKNYTVTTEYQRFSLSFKPILNDPNSTQSLIGFYGNYGSGNVPIIRKVKFEVGDTPTIYTPAPSEDYANAYPLYEGTYTDYSEAASQNPADYTWRRIIGESGQDGKDGSNGKDGQSATEVVSGYLTNEAMLVPANPQGAVSSFANATGQFVVTEGNKTISTGITFAVKSTIGCTAAITTAGVYSVSAMSADLGTIYLTAKYKDITVEKIAIVTKVKQGATGNTGPAGAKGDPTGITVSATVPTTKYTGMLWKHTGSVSGYIKNATYRWNGSSWEIYTFTAANIIAETLSAIKANLGDVHGGSYTSEFDRPLFDGSTESRKGKVLLKDGRYQLSYTNIDSRPGSPSAGNTGGTQIDEFGIQMHLNKSNGNVINATQYNSDGILMNDASLNQYGTVYLRYQDLMSLPVKIITNTTSNFEPYANSAGSTSTPTAERKMRQVQLSGAFKNKQAFSGASVMAILPVGYRPSAVVSSLAQGSGTNHHLITVSPNGEISIDRPSGGWPIGVGNWLTINMTYVAGDI